MATAGIFTDCDYCELRAATSHRAFVRNRRTGRREQVFLSACSIHEKQAIREARAKSHESRRVS